jgi:hypothetical protein
MSLHLVRFKKSASQGSPVVFKKNEVYVFNDHFKSLIPSNLIESIPFNDIAPYTNQRTLLIIRSGGIGDIIALSCLCRVPEQTILLTDKAIFPAADLWERKPAVKHFNQPLFTASSINELKRIIITIGRLEGEDIIMQGGSQNWYEVFYKSAGQPIGELRPKLREYKLETIKGCLIVEKSTSVNRTANLAELVAAASTQFEQVCIASQQKWTTRQYIEAVASFEYCISVDTSAVHIREGLGLPTLALYGAFTTDSRTKGYKHTHAIDLADYPYPNQTEPRCVPCFKHGQTPCNKNNGTPFAPCLAYIAEIVSTELENHYAAYTGK